MILSSQLMQKKSYGGNFEYANWPTGAMWVSFDNPSTLVAKFAFCKVFMEVMTLCVNALL